MSKTKIVQCLGPVHLFSGAGSALIGGLAPTCVHNSKREYLKYIVSKEIKTVLSKQKSCQWLLIRHQGLASDLGSDVKFC